MSDNRPSGPSLDRSSNLHPARPHASDQYTPSAASRNAWNGDSRPSNVSISISRVCLFLFHAYTMLHERLRTSPRPTKTGLHARLKSQCLLPCLLDLGAQTRFPRRTLPPDLPYLPCLRERVALLPIFLRLLGRKQMIAGRRRGKYRGLAVAVHRHRPESTQQSPDIPHLDLTTELRPHLKHLRQVTK